MKKIIAKKDFTIKGEIFIKDEPVDVKDIETIKKLNEKGFIYPLELKDLVILERELKKDLAGFTTDAELIGTIIKEEE